MCQKIRQIKVRQKNLSKNLSKKIVKIIHQNILQKVIKKVVKKLVKKIHQKIHRKNWSNCFSDISNTKIAQCRQKIRRHFSNKVILKLKLSKNKTNESKEKSYSAILIAITLAQLLQLPIFLCVLKSPS